MVAFISTSDVRVIGALALLLGIGSLVGVGTRYRRAWPLAALGGLLSTWGLILLWKSLSTMSDGPDGWTSVSRMMDATFASWFWAIVLGVLSGLVWVAVVSLARLGRPMPWVTVATLGGAAVAAASAAILDSTI